MIRVAGNPYSPLSTDPFLPYGTPIKDSFKSLSRLDEKGLQGRSTACGRGNAALEMLTSAAQDRVFYRVDGPDGFITGYQQLPVVPGAGTEIVYEDLVFRGDAIRLGSLQRAASSGVSAIPFTVTVAETTIARSQLAQSLPDRCIAIRLPLVPVRRTA